MNKMPEEAQKPKVLVFTTAYAPFIGGAEVAVEQVAKRLKDRFDFVIITSRMRRDLSKREVRNEGLVVRVGFGTRFDKFFLLFFGWFVVLREFNLREAKTLFWVMDFSFGAAVAGFLKIIYPKIPLVFTIQYGESEARIAAGRFGLMNLALRLILMQADFMTAISSYLLKICEKYGYIGESAVIYNGVALDKFKRADKLLSGFGEHATPSSHTIITVSRLVHKNGVDVLIKAIAGLKKEIPDIKLHIIGDGPERENLEFQVSSSKLQDSVKFIGEVSYDEIPKYLSEADVFARASRSEGMGNAFIEALAAGIPIIGTPVGGIPDIIEDGQTGLFANVNDPKDLAEKMKMLLNDGALRAQIVESGQKMIAERFDWNKIANSYERIFSQKLAMKKRILIAAGLFPPEVGGPATYSKILLGELPKNGFGVRVLSFGRVRYLPKILRHITYGFKLAAYCRNADIIYVQDPVSVGFPAAIAVKILRKRFLLKIVGDYAWEQGTQRFGVREMLDDFLKKRYGWKVEFLRKIQKFTANRAEKIIVPSEYLKKVVLSWGVKKEKIKVIYNAVDFSRGGESLSTKELVRAELGLDGKVLVSAGRLVPWKGFDVLIDAVMDLLMSFPDTKLIIIGDGPRFENLKLKVENLKLGGTVSLTGLLSREKVLKYLRASDVFVLNTAYEGMSHQLLEAMSLGVPIVTTDAGGNPELIRDGESGFLVKFNDKKAFADRISKLLSDSVLAKQFAENAEQKAREFSKERMIVETTKLIRDL